METSTVTTDIIKQMNDQISCFIKVDYVKIKVNKSTYNLPRKTHLIKRVIKINEMDILEKNTGGRWCYPSAP